MKRTMLLLAVAGLAACAPSQERLRQLATQDTADNLCVVQIVRPEWAEIARDELRRRNITCDWERTRLQAQAYIQQRQASEAAGAAQLGAAAQILSNSGPRPVSSPAPFPTPTNCRTVYQGYGVAQTTCN